MRHIFYGTVIYLLIGLMLIIHGLGEGKKVEDFSLLGLLFGWLPSIFSKKIAKWIIKK